MPMHKHQELTENPGWWQRNRETVLAQLIGVLLGVLLGGLITFFVSRHYYIKAGEELLRETGYLKKINEIMLTGMENMGWVKVVRDDKGDIVIIGTLDAVLPPLKASGKGTVGLPPEVNGKEEKAKE